MSEAVLLVGTKKGLWVGRSDGSRRRWQFDAPQFLMDGIYATCIDTSGDRPRLFVGGTSEHWGPGVYRSDDLGHSWTETLGAAVRFPAGIGASVERVWQIQPSPIEKDVVWVGTQPSALFRSEDRGESFELVRSLWDHPHRPEWGAGFGGQAIHTIVPDPFDRRRVTVAMSTGGVYRTEDAGRSWSPHNTGIKAYFFPDPWPEFGQCVHKVAAHPDRPKLMYAQNHHGVYRSEDGGTTWISIADGLPADFGFPIVVHPHDPETVFVFPLIADSARIPPDGKARVWRSTDAGRTWTASRRGLPDAFYAAVMRDAMTADEAESVGLYFGARDGSLWSSLDDGESWSEIACHLPNILCVRAAVV